VRGQVSFPSLALASLVLAAGCTTDFTGYHLEAVASASAGGSVDDAGESNAGGNAGTGSSGAGGAASAHAGAANGHAGSSDVAGAAGVPDLASAGAAGSESVTALASCDGLANTCGPSRTASCCASSLVPGGTYNRSNMAGAPATVSDFSLDDYEITVGRMRKFVAAFSQDMTPAGAGKNPANLNPDPGWSVAWNAKLPADAATLKKALLCANGTFTEAPGANEDLPVTCLSWYEAYAFCVWDGGRLPTEAEWNYAAAAGSEERPRPWGTSAPDDTNAVFCPASCGKVQTVGAKAAGNGKWGQADLVGNAWEWNLDVFANPYTQTTCLNCANTAANSNSQRAFRGGSAGNDASYLLTSTRSSRDPSDHNAFIGARCARSLACAQRTF